FLDILALGFMVPINEQFYNDAGAASYGSNADKLIYNGPYVISGWEHEVSLVMTKNEKYWNAGAVTLTEIKGLIVRDAESAVSAFIDGNLDIVDLSGSGAAIQVKAQDHEVQSFYDGATFYLELNLTRPDLQNQNIRTAIAYALNRADFCENVLKDHSAPALAFISPAVRSAGGSGSFRGKVGDLLEDNSRTKAKRLYEKGLSELDVSSLDLSILCEETESAILQANAIAAHLQANLGLELAVEPVAFGDRLQRLSGKNYDLALSGREPGYNDPLAFLELFAAGNANNHTGYSSEAYRKLLAQALITVNDKDRQKICQDMEELLLADLPIIPVYFRMQDYAVASGLKGVYRSAFQNLLFTYAYVEK
ncbi:MAG TPA: hypothetical protein DD640_06350, partial [Clostridiales bacterium]|nr:hypothetical protein [Clostridiales bacterium]